MRIGILAGAEGWHTRDLVQAAARLGHETIFMDFSGLRATVAADSLQLNCDRVLVRGLPAGSLEQVIFRMDLLHQWQAAGIHVINEPRSLECCVDKFLATVRLCQAGLPVPRTIVCQGARDAIVAFEELGGDVIVKPLFGSQGRGIVRMTDCEAAWRIFHSLERLAAVIYVQPFIRHPGWDLRALVIGDRVVAAMKRTGHGDWRTNIAQGGTAEPIELSVEDRDLAIRASRAVGAEIAGVDLLPDERGKRYVLEVNSCPGWRALVGATGIDIARAIILHITASHSAICKP